MERPKVKVVDVRGHSVFTELDDGTWQVEFGALGLTTRGATADDAYAALRDAIYATIEDDAVNQKWEAFAQAHHRVEDLPDAQWEELQQVMAQGAAASAGLAVLDAGTFDEFVNGSTPALVDYWAEWCMPCHQLAPVLRQAADRLGDRLRVGKLNIDEHRSVWERVDSQGIPTMVIYREGEPVHMIIGAGRTVDQLLAEIEPHLGE
ncbi:MAG: thioredoxin family protein [Actinomycetota bacterium]|nr:thioredoxin family protein [Actinomycetota bacterium]